MVFLQLSNAKKRLPVKREFQIPVQECLSWGGQRHPAKRSEARPTAITKTHEANLILDLLKTQIRADERR
eukprot:1160454-Pelagomonas_calceolata.AAC.6